MDDTEVTFMLKVKVKVDTRLPELGRMQEIQTQHRERAQEKLLTALRESQGFEVTEITCSLVSVPIT